MGIRALDGLLVVEVGQHFGVDYCTKLLSDHGAQVIKIEPPGGDPVRQIPPYAGDVRGIERSGIFQHINSGKQSVVLDLDTEAGQDKFRSIASQADVIVDGLSAAGPERAMLGLSGVSATNGTKILASITPFGLTANYGNFVGGELSALALGGLMYLHGDPNREPIMLAGHQAHYHSGMHAAIAIIAALMRRAITGAGAQIDVSIIECVAYLLSGGPRTYHKSGTTYKRRGSRLFFSIQELGHYPSTILRCKDGYVFVHSAGAGLEELAVLVGEPRLASDWMKQLKDDDLDEVDKMFEPWLLAHGKMEIMELAQLLRLSCGAVLTTKEVLDNEHFRAREWFVPVSHPVLGDIEMQAPPFVLQATPGEVHRAPLLGEHTDLVLSKVNNGISLVT